MAVRITHRVNEWAESKARKADEALLDAATDVHRLAGMYTAKQTHALEKSGRVEKVKQGHLRVVFGGGPVKYARRRHYENKKTPGSLHYLERAGDSIARVFGRYLKGL